MKVRRETRTGDLVFIGMSPLTAAVLHVLPAILADDAAGSTVVGASPYPEDDALTLEWRRLAGPDLAHLFASARELVLADIAAMVPVRKGKAFRLRIPAVHEAAWMSSLTAARLHLAELHGFDAAAMEAGPAMPPETNRDRALLVVDHLGWLLSVLLDVTSR